MRVQHHPILPSRTQKDIAFYFNGQVIKGIEGDTVASALWASGIRALRVTEKAGNGRGIFCGIGHCYDCRIYQEHFGMVRACITPIQERHRFFSEEGGLDNCK
ncbi:(2Fe-2S)-binding protein [Bacillus songklensis]|uniref:(2Fe-2S)-binding protein n=1 Tax=Bacillus songklensis TaxID=1069116 RepID=A0ABV8B7I9_9BACI